jgi:hypothetical protein
MKTIKRWNTCEPRTSVSKTSFMLCEKKLDKKCHVTARVRERILRRQLKFVRLTYQYSRSQFRATPLVRVSLAAVKPLGDLSSLSSLLTTLAPVSFHPLTSSQLLLSSTTTNVYWYTIHVSSSAGIHGQFYHTLGRWALRQPGRGSAGSDPAGACCKECSLAPPFV